MFVYKLAHSFGCACSVRVVSTAHDRTPGPAGGGPPCWNFVSVGQLSLEVNLVDLLAQGQPQGVLPVVVVGPGVNFTREYYNINSLSPLG